MRKLILALSTLFIFSCTSEDYKTKVDFPQEIIMKRDSLKFDTVLVISNEKELFFFNKKREYVYHNKKMYADYGAGVFVGVVIIIFIIIILCALFSSL